MILAQGSKLGAYEGPASIGSVIILRLVRQAMRVGGEAT